MLKTFAAFVLLAATPLALAQSPLYLEYEGVRTGVKTVSVTCVIHRTQDGMYVKSTEPDRVEHYLERGGRALQLSDFTTDTGNVADITEPAFFGIMHIPYIPTILHPTARAQADKEFVMMTGQTVSEPTRPRGKFSRPIEGSEDLGTSRRITAGAGANIKAELELLNMKSLAGVAFPGQSKERYKDGRGTYGYEWKLVMVLEGDDVPELPNPEEFLGPDAVVQDRREEPILSFGYKKGNGNLDEQYRAAHAINAGYEKWKSEAEEKEKAQAAQQTKERVSNAFNTQTLLGIAAIVGVGGVLVFLLGRPRRLKGKAS